MDRSKNSSRKDGISHKIGDHKHQFRRKDLGGRNLLFLFLSNLFFVFYSFRFMPAQLTRFGIDRNSAILSIAWRVILLSNFILLQKKNFFFFRTTVLLGGSSVKKLTELYDLTKLLCFGLCRYRLSTKSFS